MDILKKHQRINKIFGENYRELKIPYDFYLNGQKDKAIKSLKKSVFPTFLKDEIKELIDLLKS